MNNSINMIIMAFVFFGVIFGVHYYLWLRLIRTPALPAPWSIIGTVAIIALAVSIPANFFMSRQLSFETARLVTYVPFLWMGVMMLLFFAFLSIDVAKGVFFVVKKLAAPGSPVLDPSKRIALAQIAAGGTALLVSGMAGAGVVQAARKASIKRIPITLTNFPTSLNGLKIVQISDLHIGITAGKKWLQQLVQRINDLHPDVIAITGDLTDGDPQKLFQEIEPLRHLEAKHGTFFVTGNHEYYSNVNRWIKHIKALGIRVLRNESVLIGNQNHGFYLAGVDDYAARGMVPGHGQDISAAVNGIDPDKAVVLLAHQPKAVLEASQKGIGLVLSGHTHGGQIWPFNYFVGLQQPYNKGLYTHSETTQIYVNQGTFLWGPPMRLGTECEITEIVLQGT